VVGESAVGAVGGVGYGSSEPGQVLLRCHRSIPHSRNSSSSSSSFTPLPRYRPPCRVLSTDWSSTAASSGVAGNRVRTSNKNGAGRAGTRCTPAWTTKERYVWPAASRTRRRRPYNSPSVNTSGTERPALARRLVAAEWHRQPRALHVHPRRWFACPHPAQGRAKSPPVRLALISADILAYALASAPAVTGRSPPGASADAQAACRAPCSSRTRTALVAAEAGHRSRDRSKYPCHI
jgi:hypothetical protein